MAETVKKMILNLEKEHESSCKELENVYNSHSSWLAEAVQVGKRKILESCNQPRKKSKKSDDGKENLHPNRSSDASVDDFGVKHPIASEGKPKTSINASNKLKYNDDDNIDVSLMKVVELRKELKKRGLETKGLKRDLQERLEDALKAAAEEREKQEKEENEIATDSRPAPSEEHGDISSSLQSGTTVSGAVAEIPVAEVFMEIDQSVVPVETKLAPVVTETSVKAMEAEILNKAPETADTCDDHAISDVEMEDVSLNMNKNVTESVFTASTIKEIPTTEQLRTDEIKEVQELEKQKNQFEGSLPSPKKKQTLTGKLLKSASKIFSPTKANPVKNNAHIDLSKEQLLQTKELESMTLTDKLESDAQHAEGSASKVENALNSHFSVEKAFGSGKPPFTKPSFIEAEKETSSRKATRNQKEITPIPSFPTKPSNTNYAKGSKTKIAAGSTKKKISCASSSSSVSSLSSSSTASSRRADALRKKKIAKEAERKALAENRQALKATVPSKSSRFHTSKKNVVPNSSSAVRYDDKDLKAQQHSSSKSGAKMLYKNQEEKQKAAARKLAEAARKERNEKQKARLAEIRGKAAKIPTQVPPPGSRAQPDSASEGVPIPPPQAVSKPHPQTMDIEQSKRSDATGPGVITAVTMTDEDKLEKKKLLAAQMREKAKATNVSNTVTAAYKKTAVFTTTNTNTQQASFSVPQLKHQPQQKDSQPQQLQQQRLKPMSPMDTYEMSDREDSSDSEEDSDSDESGGPRKRIPSWAQRSNLMGALKKQFADGPARLDPDTVFGEVHSCDLEAIFDQKKARYSRRTSSGNWTQDRVTVMEKLTYKRDMGFSSSSKRA